jgi:hypothetical protein
VRGGRVSGQKILWSGARALPYIYAARRWAVMEARLVL